MSDRADAHVHLFEGGYPGSFPARPGVRIEEIECYESLMAEHDVRAALVVAFEGGKQCEGNSRYLARMVGAHAWMRPTAYFEPEKIPTVEGLETLRDEGFIGISFYIFDGDGGAALPTVADEVWNWLEEHRWLISVNSRADHWEAWRPVLQRHGDLRLVASHLGLPPAVTESLDTDSARSALASMIQLASYPGLTVKLSGFYAVSEPEYDYPHIPSWPYVEVLLGTFGGERLLWGSDFMPALDYLSFGQTYGHFAKMPFLTDAQVEGIEGGNLLRLFDQVR